MSGKDPTIYTCLNIHPIRLFCRQWLVSASQAKNTLLLSSSISILRMRTKNSALRPNKSSLYMSSLLIQYGMNTYTWHVNRRKKTRKEFITYAEVFCFCICADRLRRAGHPRTSYRTTHFFFVNLNHILQCIHLMFVGFLHLRRAFLGWSDPNNGFRFRAFLRSTS